MRANDQEIPQSTAAAHEELKDRAARGVAWVMLGTGAQRGVLYISTLVLAHLLHPEAFGLVAIASTVITASSVLRDLGLGDTLIQRPQLDRREQGTVLSLMMLSGLVMAGILAALSPLLSDFFHNPRLEPIILALSPVLALGGLIGFYDNVFQRELQYRLRTYVFAVQSVLYVIISIILAVLGFGVWSMVAAQLASLVLSALVQLRLAAPYLVWPTFSRAAARETLHTGRAFLLGGAVDFARQNTDYISIGRFLSATQLSFYYSAFRVCDTVGGAIADAFTRISFSSFSRLRAQGTDASASYLSTSRLVGLVSCPIGILLSAAAAPFVKSAYGHQWLDMIPVLTVLGLWIAIRVLENVFAWLLISAGYLRVGVRIIALSYLGQLPSIVAAASISGIVAVAWVMLGYTALTGLVFVVFLWRRAGLSLGSQWRALRPVTVACIPTWLAARGVSIAIANPFVALPLATLAGVGVYIAALAVAEPGLPRWGYRQAQRVIRRRSLAGTASVEGDRAPSLA